MNKKQIRQTFKIILSVAALVLAVLFSDFKYLSLGLYIISYAFAGLEVLIKAVRSIINGQVFNEKLLMTVATIGAFYLGEYAEGCAVMLFFKIGELFESIAVGKSRKSIAALMDIKPETACVLSEEGEKIVSPEEVTLGEIILIRAGERIPLDGIVLKGSTTVDAASLTGESLPIRKTVGDLVQSGTVNLSGVISVKTTSEYKDSTVAGILELIESAAAKKTKTESFITRFAAVYTPTVVIIALFLGLIPPIFSGSLGNWLKRGLIFLVVSCPCALVVSVPLSFFGGIGGASKKGILIKGSGYIETLAKVNAVFFDKTGTITEGGFSINKLNAASVSEEELLNLASAIEKGSNHPIARAISKYETPYEANNVTEISGCGIKSMINGREYYLGNAALMEKVGVDFRKTPENETVVYLSEGRSFLGSIQITDRIKNESKSVIAKLHRLGIKKTVMLTGDNKETALKIAEECNIKEYFAELLPENKVMILENYIKGGYKTAFLGDGINDAPVLSRADVGIAMGALGSDAAIEAADIVIMDDNISKLATSLKIAKKTMRIVKQNIIFALAVKGIIMIFSVVGLSNMWIAVFGDVGVTVLAILNAMRCFKIK